jgi:hypothetical protein
MDEHYLEKYYTTLKNYNINAHDAHYYPDWSSYPDTRRVPDKICEYIDVPFGTLTDLKFPPFSKMSHYISGNFWILVNANEFNGLTSSHVYLILNCWDRDNILGYINKNDGVWKRLRDLFEQSHPDIDINSDKEYIALRKWLKKNMIECLNRFYNLCHERELPLHSADVGFTKYTSDLPIET